MCDFKVGDEIEGFRESGVPWTPEQGLPPPPVGHIGVATLLVMGPEGLVLELDNWPTEERWGLDPTEFRKVQRRDLQAWLASSNTIEGPVRQREPA